MNPIIKGRIGKGSAGEVYLCMLPNSNEYYALKKIDRKEADRPQVKKYFQTEIAIMKELKDNNNIIHFIGLQETNSHYNIIMEYCNGGSLLSCLNKYMKKYKKPFPEEYVQHLMRQIVNALICIHDHDIIHRDIKSANILVKFASEGAKRNLNMMHAQIKISDFGISARGPIAFTAIGSLAYMDPFIYKKHIGRNDLVNSEGYNKSADIWSLGAVCYEMLIGKRVFNGRNKQDLYNNLEKGNYSIPTNLSQEAVSFINGMLQYDSDKRLSAKELARHYFLTRNTKNFHKIDCSLLRSKIGPNGLKINTIKNKKIWDIFNNDEEVYDSITSTNFLEKIPTEEAEDKNTIPQFPKNSNTHSINSSNFLEQTPTEGAQNKNSVRQFPKYSYVNNIQKLNNIENRNRDLNNNVMKLYQKQKSSNIINNNININTNNLNFENNNNHNNMNNMIKSQLLYNNNKLYQQMNIHKSNISKNEITQTYYTSENVNDQKNHNKYQNIYNQNNNIISSNIYNQNYNNSYKNIYDKFNNQSFQVVYNQSNNRYQNANNRNSYNIFQNANNQNNYNTYQNINNRNANNLFNY